MREINIAAFEALVIARRIFIAVQVIFKRPVYGLDNLSFELNFGQGPAHDVEALINHRAICNEDGNRPFGRHFEHMVRLVA